ncbi:hypothetical protein R3P38DRAFT_2912139 [Favolaschia claudopus]|uniref:Uncharacterized protein n=1 Tax=Favolaschia claudopus TaxID=2862362 RepID=A0AAW0C6L4_9AGAR
MVKVSMRRQRLFHDNSMSTFEPVSKDGSEAPWCLNCKNDDHAHWGCYFVLDDPDHWFGNKETNLSSITEGILGKPWNRKEARPSGPPTATSNQGRRTGGSTGGKRGAQAPPPGRRGGR